MGVWVEVRMGGQDAHASVTCVFTLQLLYIEPHDIRVVPASALPCCAKPDFPAAKPGGVFFVCQRTNRVSCRVGVLPP